MNTCGQCGNPIEDKADEVCIRHPDASNPFHKQCAQLWRPVEVGHFLEAENERLTDRIAEALDTIDIYLQAGGLVSARGLTNLARILTGNPDSFKEWLRPEFIEYAGEHPDGALMFAGSLREAIGNIEVGNVEAAGLVYLQGDDGSFRLFADGTASRRILVKMLRDAADVVERDATAQ